MNFSEYGTMLHSEQSNIILASVYRNQHNSTTTTETTTATTPPTPCTPTGSSSSDSRQSKQARHNNRNIKQTNKQTEYKYGHSESRARAQTDGRTDKLKN